MNLETLLLVIGILLMHYVFDFLLQSHWMATNKSKDDWALTLHALTYTLGLALVAIAMWCEEIMTPQCAATWVLANSCLHFYTDYLTSRINARLFGVDWHNFFAMVGGDQMIHYCCLFTTLYLYCK